MKLLLWNLQDFFVFLDKLEDTQDPLELDEPHWQIASSSFKPNKLKKHLNAMAEFIELHRPDICLFTEVGGPESIHNFNHYFLKNTYKASHFASNSDRGIDLAILYKKDLDITGDRFHNDKAFARGVHELRFNFNSTPICVLLTHLKSKLDKEKKDFEGRSKRAREVARLLKIAQKRESQGNKVIIAGDLNGVIYEDETEPELALFAKNLGLIDVLEHLKRPFFERATYLYYNRNSEIIPMQLDYVLMDSELAKKLDDQMTGVFDFDGKPREAYPRNLEEKKMQPSDHYPIIVKLNS